MLLVTGSCGAIGRAILPHLARALGRQDGPLPLVLAARDPARVRSLLPGLLQRGARLARLDLEEPGDFRRLEALPVSGVLHLAGLTRTGSARQIQESNLEGTRRLAHAARQAGAERLIFISTPMVGQMTDDNGDGVVDDLDVPDIAAIYRSRSDSYRGVVRLLSGDGTGEHWTAYEVESGYHPYYLGSLALADLEGDGWPEVLLTVYEGSDSFLACLNNDGTTRWVDTVND